MFEDNALDPSDDFIVTEAKKQDENEKYNAADLVETLEENEENNFISNSYSGEINADVLSPYKETTLEDSALFVVSAPDDLAPADPPPYVEAAPADPAPYVEAAPADIQPYVERSPWWHIFRRPLLPFEKSSSAPSSAPAHAPSAAPAQVPPRYSVPRYSPHPFPAIPGSHFFLNCDHRHFIMKRGFLALDTIIFLIISIPCSRL